MNSYLVATIRSLIAGMGATAAVLTTTQNPYALLAAFLAAFLGSFSASFLAHFGGDSGPVTPAKT